MKTLILAAVTVLSSSSAFAAGPTMSAFATDTTIYVTVLGDGCNAVGGNLEVDGICNEDRLTRNYAVQCSASLSLMMTEMMCPADRPPKATVLEFDIKESKIASEAKILKIRTGSGDEITVQLK